MAEPTNLKLSSEQLQRMEMNRRKAKEKLTVAGKKQKHSSGDRVRTLQGPGTPVRIGRECAASTVTDEEQVVSRSQSVAAACQVIAEAPVKSKRGKSERNFCAVCLGEIVDGRHEAIFCEGRCNAWYHRGCASVSQELLRELTASEELFLCLMCSRRAFKEEISHLKAEVAFLKSELKLIPAMKTSIEALHRDVVDLQSKSNIGAKQSLYSEAVRLSGPRDRVQAVQE